MNCWLDKTAVLWCFIDQTVNQLFRKIIVRLKDNENNCWLKLYIHYCKIVGYSYTFVVFLSKLCFKQKLNDKITKNKVLS